MNNFWEQLNPEQQKAVRQIEGPLLILAGAGSGKTRVITYRIAYLLSRGIPPEAILAVTFTNKAAKEMQRRVEGLVPERGQRVWISTFHSFAARFLRQEHHLCGLLPNFVIYDDDDQKSVLRECLRELNLDEKKYKVGDLLEVISRAKDELLDVDSYRIYAEASADSYRQFIAGIYRSYQEKLSKANALDFGDLIMKTVTVLREDSRLRECYQNRFQYLLVDEYQDTNPAQYLLVRYLAGKSRNICVVGDDDQAIYSWRGADIRNILEFENDFPEAEVICLEQNYRSARNILDCALRLIKYNHARKDKKLWTANQCGEPVEYNQFEDAAAEARGIVREIQRLVNEGYSLNDITVFYRTNAQSRLLEDWLNRTRTPYQIFGGIGFYQRREIKDVLAYLRVLLNPVDNLSFKRIINIAGWGVGKTTLEILERFASEKGMALSQLGNFLAEISKLGLTARAEKSLRELYNLLDRFRTKNDRETPLELVVDFLESSGYLERLREENTAESQERLRNVEELVSALASYSEESEGATLEGFLETVALLSGIDHYGPEQGKVTLMTLHLAKGLEFPVVFITGIEEGLLPIGESSFSPAELEEERRLFYVGITRTKNKLYLSSAAIRKLYGHNRYGYPSHFLEEAGIISSTVPEIDDKVTGRDNATDIDLSAPRDSVPAAGERFRVGDWIRHPQFGCGRITEVSGSGEDCKLIIVFENGTWKKIALKYVTLERVR